MKLSRVLEIIGSGSILLMAGVGLLLLGVGFGFSEATHLPLWATLCGLGLLCGIVGVLVLDRGTEEAEEQVKAVTPNFDAVQSPWFMIGAAIIGGMVLQRVFRRTPPKVEMVVQAPTPVIEPVAPIVHSPQTEPLRVEPKAFSLSQHLSDQLRKLGAVAADTAFELGVKALGVPSVEQLIDELMGANKQQTESKVDPEPKRASAPEARPTPTAVSREPWGKPTSNGWRLPGEFDPTAG